MAGRRWAVGTLAVSTLVFAGAGLLASRLVPVGYRASTELAVTDMPAGMAALQAAAATGDASYTATVTRTGLLISHRAPTVGEAEAHVRDAADRIEARVSSLRTQTPKAEPAPVAAVPPPVPDNVATTASVAPEGKPTPALAELQRAAEAARRDLDDTSRALDAFQNGEGAAEADPSDRLRIAKETVAARAAELSSLQQDRSRVAASQATPAQVQAINRIGGRDELAQGLAQRLEARTEVAELSRTLLNGHPRMADARARLRSLDERVEAARGALLRTLDGRIVQARRRSSEAEASLAEAVADDSRRRALDMRATELLRARDLAREVSFRLDAAILQVAESPAVPSSPPPVPPMPPVAQIVEPAPVAAPVPVEPALRFVRTAMPTEVEHAEPLPVAAASGVFGFALAGFGLAMRRRRAGDAMPASRPAAAEVIDAPLAPLTRTPEGTGPDVTPIDDVIDGAISSGITRIMLCGAGPTGGARPLAVSIARRLSLRGRAVALVDLSASQTASRTMGAGASAPTVGDLIDGRATFAAVAARDFATQAEIVPGGSPNAQARPASFAERRNVLDFAEKSYETIIVDCTGLAAIDIAALMDPDAALLLAVDGLNGEAIRAQMETLREAGLADMILVRESAVA